MYLKENVSQAVRKAVMFTNYVKLKDNPSDKWKDFMIYTCNFSVRFSFYITYPLVLSLHNLKLTKTQKVKNICMQEKLIFQLIFNLGLALTDSHTNQSRLRRTRSRPGQGQCFESSYSQKIKP